MPGDWQNKACRSKETLIGELVSLSRHLKRTPRLSDVKNPTIYYKVFGSWNNALREASLPINKPRSPRIDARKQKRQLYRMSDGYFLESLRKLANLIGGRRPQGKDFESKEAVEAGIPALCSYTRRFGSLQRALELAGLGQLPGEKDLQKKLREEKIHRGVEEAMKVLAAKPYVFTDQLKGWDVSARLLREELGRRGVVVLRRVKAAGLERALDMYYGVGEEKVAREQMRALMGDRAFETFEKYASGGRCCEIARELGCSREWIRLAITNGIRRFFRRLNGECRKPAADAGKHPGKTSWVRFRAKFSADGMPVPMLLRTGQNLTRTGLAYRAGVSLSTVTKTENGIPVTFRVAEKLACALGTGIYDIFESVQTNGPQPQEKQAFSAGDGAANEVSDQAFVRAVRGGRLHPYCRDCARRRGGLSCPVIKTPLLMWEKGKCWAFTSDLAEVVAAEMAVRDYTLRH